MNSKNWKGMSRSTEEICEWLQMAGFIYILSPPSDSLTHAALLALADRAVLCGHSAGAPVVVAAALR